jgi:copper oxidase (laccase) domain-containing protein
LNSIIKVGDWRISLLTKETGCPKGVFFPKQVHGKKIVCFGDGLDPVGDGVVVRASQRKVGVYTADCLPLVMMTLQAAVVLHLSRKSLVRGIMEEVGSHVDTQEINRIYIGPHICGDHLTYEERYRDSDVYKFKRKFPEAVHEKGGLWLLSVRQALWSYVVDWGITEENILADGRCTFEDLSLASRRRGARGRNYTVVWKES